AGGGGGGGSNVVNSPAVLLNAATAARLFHASDGTGFAALTLSTGGCSPIRTKFFLPSPAPSFSMGSRISSPAPILPTALDAQIRQRVAAIAQYFPFGDLNNDIVVLEVAQFAQAPPHRPPP